MKRSEVNRYILEAIAYFQEQRVALPPFASWSPKVWETLGPEANEIRQRKLGWDVTDFGSEKFPEVGLTALTLRNGASAAMQKPYAEKILFAREGQRIPFHFHFLKIEDIINRGGAGAIRVQLYNAELDGAFAKTPISVFCDGIMRTISPGDCVVLRFGESLTIPPRLYHEIYAVGGDALMGEVSSVNDDDSDNRFYRPVPRYSAIEEDELPLWWLCTEYPGP